MVISLLLGDCPQQVSRRSLTVLPRKKHVRKQERRSLRSDHSLRRLSLPLDSGKKTIDAVTFTVLAVSLLRLKRGIHRHHWLAAPSWPHQSAS
jgi:hypothetical protein